MNLLDHDLSIPGGDFLTHLDDTYVGAGEHDDPVPRRTRARARALGGPGCTAPKFNTAPAMSQLINSGVFPRQVLSSTCFTRKSATLAREIFPIRHWSRLMSTR